MTASGALEDIFGTMKNEMFYGRDYTNATLDELEAKMDEYIVWHNEKRQKRSLGSMSSLQYRCSLGLVA
ncbi:MAG: IS3 family transposase [Coriobacteriaceae bacterium]